MKERPILFSAPMVRALLDGRKTQTRRLFNPAGCGFDGIDRAKPLPEPFRPHQLPGDERTGIWRHRAVGFEFSANYRCPYGVVGDRLWVKETWRTGKTLDALKPTAIAEKCLDAGYEKPWAPIMYPACGWFSATDVTGIAACSDGFGGVGKTRVSIHMPRWASRITLEVTEVRVERLQSISEADALAEGVQPLQMDGGSALPRFEGLWCSINGAGSWAADPWVWCVSFKRVEKAIGGGA